MILQAPRGDSKGNGHAERAVRSIEEAIRLQKLALEGRLKEKLLVSHPVFAWLVEFAADVLNKMQVGKDGRTGFERVKGKRFRGQILPLGVPVMARISGSAQGGLMQDRWIEGFALGSRFHTNEVIVGRRVDGCVVRARGVRELPGEVKLSDLDAIKGLPHAPAGVIQYERDPGNLDVQPNVARGLPPAEANAEPGIKPRSVRITHDMLLKHGYTARCLKCRSLLRGDVQGSGGHSVACRERSNKLLRREPKQLMVLFWYS